MNSICYGALLPHEPLLLSARNNQNSDAAVAATVQAMTQVFGEIKAQGIQTLVILSSKGVSVDDSIVLGVQPRLRGVIAANDREGDLSLAFETDGLLLKTLQRQTERLGIDLLPLTVDKAKSLRLPHELDAGVLVPLFFLHQSGFRGQILYLAAGRAPYEELYTLGRALQAAASVSGRSVGVIACGELAESTPELGTRLLAALAKSDWKGLMQLDQSQAKAAGATALGAGFFLAGALGGLALTGEILTCQLFNEQIQVAARFAR